MVLASLGLTLSLLTCRLQHPEGDDSVSADVVCQEHTDAGIALLVLTLSLLNDHNGVGTVGVLYHMATDS